MKWAIPLLLVAASCFADGGQTELEARCKEISNRLEKLLGPKFTKPVPVRVVDSEFIARFAKELEAKQTPPAKRDAMERLLVQLGLAPRDFDLSKSQIELFRRIVAGLYDADADCFYVVRGKGDPESPTFLATASHELAHAYRDVDKPFWKQMNDNLTSSEDYAIAVSCLAEGDAELIALRVGLELREEDIVRAAKRAPDMTVQAMANPLYRSIPLVVREQIVTRYLIGQAFAAHVLEAGGWKALEKAYDNPPRSTEQILHPEKYLGESKDEPVDFPDLDPNKALGDGWSLRHSSTWGEFMVRVVLTEALGRKGATRVAEGWDGLRFFISEKEDADLALSIVSEWDTESDAKEFAAGWKAFAERRRETRVTVQQSGRRVLIVEGAPKDTHAAVLRVLASAKSVE